MESHLPAGNNPSTEGPSTRAGNRPGARRRGAQACVICNKRKIRCILPSDGGQCQNCKTFDYQCVPHQRKRKRYSIVDCEDPEGHPSRKTVSVVARAERPQTVPSPKPRSVSGTVATTPEQHIQQAQTPQETAEFVQAALTAQFGSGNGSHLPALPEMITAVQASGTMLEKSPGSASAAYLGRSKYLGDELEEHEESIAANDNYQANSTLTPDDWEVLHLRRAFDLPSRAVCESLVATFVARCDPWMPVLEQDTLQSLLQGRMNEIPLIIVQAVLMAGSRMRTESSMLEEASTQDLYNRAKVLFFSGYEKDPMTLLTAVAVLQYWNPSGPSQISIHNSSYWLRIGVGLVHQMGLHKEPGAQDPRRSLKRRIFWTLFARDSLLSAGQGRPRAIHLEDCSVKWPDVADFPIANTRAHLWVAYVGISGILGDLSQWHLRGCPEGENKTHVFERDIKDWILNLPSELRVCDDQGNMLSYDCNTRFLYLPYFTAISILYKPKLPSGPKGSPQLTLGSTIAASCVARIFEDALARNEVRHGVAMQAIYLLIAGICQLGSYGRLNLHDCVGLFYTDMREPDYPLLWRASAKETNTISLSLMELSKTWQTAEDTLHILQRLQERVGTVRPNPNPPPLLVQGLDFALFKPFGPTFCTKLQIVVDNIANNPTFRAPEGRNNDGLQATGTAEIDRDGGMAGFATLGGVQAAEGSFTSGEANTFDLDSENLMSTLLEDLGAESLFNGENWFLQDLC